MASPPDLVSPGDPAVSLAAAAPSDLQPRYVTSNIEDIRVGDRVLGRNPELTDAERTIPDPDPATWRRLELRAPKVDGSWADVVLLRSLSWLQEQQAEVGGQVWISVPECGIDGHATVLAIGPCPPIPPGPGRVVTGTFRHASARVLDLQVDSLAEPIGTTANHPFWSVDREAFVRADSLAVGERLRALDGIDRVLAVSRRARPEPVYNLEVHMEHVYHVGHSGVLVHNGGLLPCPKAPGATQEAYAGVRQASEQMREAGIPRHIRKQVLESFDRKAMRVRVAGEAEYGIRYYDNVNAWPRGRFLFEEFPATRNSHALPPEWNQMQYFQQWRIRPGTTIFEGPAARQGYYPGGQVQKYIPNLDDLIDP